MRTIAWILATTTVLCTGVANSQDLFVKELTLQLTGGRVRPVYIGDISVPDHYVARVLSGDDRVVPLDVVDGAVWMLLPPDVPAGPSTFTFKLVDAGNVPEHESKRVRLVKREDEDAIDVFVGEKGDSLFTSYHYSNENRKPYLWPVKSEGDASVTRDWPMGEAGASKDHPHHVSFWTGYGDINGHDYWEYGERTGWQRTESIEFGSGNACGWITTHIVWEDKDRKPVIDEYRTFRFYASPPESGARLFDVDVRFVASYGAVKFGDTKEGGIVSVRVADALRERGGTGTITTSEGVTGGTAAWGKPAAWCDYSGTIEGAGVRGIAVFDHPSSFRYPTHWHVRDYGLMGANPFGYSHFYNGAKNGDHTVEADGTLSFSYRMYVHSGDANLAQVAEYYDDFANPPKVTIE